MWIQKVAGGGVSYLAYSSDGQKLYTFDGGGWVTAWDLATRAKQRLFQLNGAERYDTRSLFLVGGRYLLAQTLGYAHVWDTGANVALPSLPVNVSFGFMRPARSGATVQFIGQDRKGLDAYDVSTGQLTRVLHSPPELGALVWFDTSPDGSTIVINSERRVVLTRPDGSSIPVTGHFPGGSARFSPDGGSLVWMTMNRLQIWNASDLSVRVEGVSCAAPYSVFAFHPTAPVVAALNCWHDLTLFSLETGQAIRTLDFELGKGVQCVAFAPDGLTCAVGGTNKQFVVFDVDL